MSSTDRRPEMQRMAFGQQPFAGLFFDAKETKAYMDALERYKQAYEMMDDWFGDSMTQNQVDIIDTILDGGEE